MFRLVVMLFALMVLAGCSGGGYSASAGQTVDPSAEREAQQRFFEGAVHYRRGFQRLNRAPGKTTAELAALLRRAARDMRTGLDQMNDVLPDIQDERFRETAGVLLGPAERLAGVVRQMPRAIEAGNARRYGKLYRELQVAMEQVEDARGGLLQRAG